MGMKTCYITKYRYLRYTGGKKILGSEIGFHRLEHK